MRNKLIFPILFFISMTFTSFGNSQEEKKEESPPPIFRVKVNKVVLPFLATNKGRVVHDLTKETVRVFIKAENESQWKEMGAQRGIQFRRMVA